MADGLKDRVANTRKPKTEEEIAAVIKDGEEAMEYVAEHHPELLTPVDGDPENVTITVALARVMREVKGVAKRQLHDSPGARFNFRGIDAVMNAVGPALRAHGVIVLPSVKSAEYRDVLTSKGKPAREVTVVVEYTFIAPDGSMLSVTVPGEAMDNGDKGTAKAMSVAFRVALLQTLCLPTDEPDPDSQAYERARDVPVTNPADEARDGLLAYCEAEGLDPKKVNAAFHRIHEKYIPACQDAGQLRAFQAELENDPDAVLNPPKDPEPEPVKVPDPLPEDDALFVTSKDVDFEDHPALGDREDWDGQGVNPAELADHD